MLKDGPEWDSSCKFTMDSDNTQKEMKKKRIFFQGLSEWVFKLTSFRYFRQS